MQTLVQGAKELRLPLTAAQLHQFDLYRQEVMAHAAALGLTAIQDAEGIQRRHFLESLALLAALQERQIMAETAIDIGSGAGFPGLPLKIVQPDLRLTLLEATRKKATFLDSLAQHLGLTGVLVIAARAEELAHHPDHREKYDLALARALAPLSVLAELALPFLRIGGWLASPKGSRAAQEAAAAQAALALCGGGLEAVAPLPTPYAEVSPTLVLVRKMAPTPSRYPRRAGIPAKRPLR